MRQNIQKKQNELVHKPIKQPNRRFLHINLALKIIVEQINHAVSKKI